MIKFLAENIVSVLQIIAVLAAALAAWGALRTAKETKNIVLAQIINDIRDQFDSPEISECKIVLSGIVIDDGIGKMGKMFAMRELIPRGGYQRSREVWEFVRIYYNLFHKIKILLDTKFINSETLRKIILPDELDVLFKNVEPLVKDDHKYDTLIFETYRKIFEYEVT